MMVEKMTAREAMHQFVNNPHFNNTSVIKKVLESLLDRIETLEIQELKTDKDE